MTRASIPDRAKLADVASDAGVGSDSGAVAIHVTAPMSAVGSMSATVAIWEPWGLGHIHSARLFASAAEDLERQIAERGSPGDHFRVHRANVTAAVFHAVAFLDALVSTVGVSIRDNRLYRPPDLSTSAIERICTLSKETWDRLDRLPLLERMQLLAQLTPAGQLDVGQNPYADTNLLMKIRNLLTHPDPELVPVGEPHRLEKWCRGKFAPFQEGGNPWLPNGLLGAGLARWSVTTVEAFAAEWCGRVGLVFDRCAATVSTPAAEQSPD
ncbi:hypothetical protein P3H80_14505 [Mycolicibacterium septicum]|uniref:hypothetical protein n=1 Tax=Mycolicibacterium septicum TaxID=98668 RepID=UPI0023E1E42B|nr:hypothetical protein [Mycolicibacterium septicum]MDF3338644.1 hypothetical protein [Mycolicibacterium septicum]